MRRLPSHNSVIRFKLASLSLFILMLLYPATLLVLLYSFFVMDKNLTAIALGLMGGSTLLTAIQWLISSRARCPLCHVKAIAINRCSTHRDAKRLFGSYRLRVARTVLFKNRLDCPYCGESALVKARLRARSRRV